VKDQPPSRRRLHEVIHAAVERHLDEHLHEHLYRHRVEHHGLPPDHPDGPYQRPPWAGGPPWTGGYGPHWGNPEFWQHVHARRRDLRQRWRRFSGAHLRRRLFLWFGLTIVLTTVMVGCLAHFARVGTGVSRIPVILYFLVPAAVLWAATGKVARRIARPLDELVRVAQDIGRGRLDARVRLDRSGIDEIAELSRAVNDMATRIEAQMADQRELLAGVSHEIRTPLARLRLLVEIARERGPGSTNLVEIERELIEIDALVGELLASARLDFRAVNAVPLDGREVALRAAERAGVPAERVTIQAADTAFVGDPTLLARALANLLQNARVHGGGPERLVVRQGGQGGQGGGEAGDHPGIEIAVLDRGPGFAPGDEQRVFERFYRKDAAPTEGGPGGGTTIGGSARTGGGRADGLGLGLALVRRIAEAHGGTATARNRAEGPGAEVALWLPRVSPAGEASAANRRGT
jgi:signal transduction histidine kinase